jgi:hypothetical protein
VLFNFSSGQKISHSLYYLRAKYNVQKSLPFNHIQRQLKVFNILALYLSRIHFNIVIPSVRTFSKLFLDTFPLMPGISFSFPTRMVHFMHTHLITTIIVIEVILIILLTFTTTLLRFPASKSFFSILFSSIFNLHYSVRISICTSHSYKRRDRILILKQWPSDLRWETAT